MLSLYEPQVDVLYLFRSVVNLIRGTYLQDSHPICTAFIVNNFMLLYYAENELKHYIRSSAVWTHWKKTFLLFPGISTSRWKQKPWEWAATVPRGTVLTTFFYSELRELRRCSMSIEKIRGKEYIYIYMNYCCWLLPGLW